MAHGEVQKCRLTKEIHRTNVEVNIEGGRQRRIISDQFENVLKITGGRSEMNKSYCMKILMNLKDSYCMKVQVSQYHAKLRPIVSAYPNKNLRA